MVHGSGSNLEMDNIVIPLDENERILSLQMALKCSDLGHVGWGKARNAGRGCGIGSAAWWVRQGRPKAWTVTICPRAALVSAAGCAPLR